MKKLISIVIPAYNESEVLDELARRIKSVISKIKNYDFEIIIVENGSVDNSYQKLLKIRSKDKRFKILQLSRNFGCDGGITAGLQFAKGDAAILMNADLQDPPELIPNFLDKWEKGYEIVNTIIKKREGINIFRRFFSSFFYMIINRLTQGQFPRNASDFKLIDKRVYRVINNMNEQNRFLRGMINWTGFKSTGIKFIRPNRFAGKPKAGFFTIWGVAMNGIFSFSNFPLKMITGIGFLLFLVSIVFLIIQFALFLIKGREVPGFTTIMMTLLFLFSMLFLMLGLVGTYVSRIYEEVKQRPNYIVKNKEGLN